MNETNNANLCGRMTSECKFSHKTFGEAFYTFNIGILRNSGYEDQVIIMASERILNSVCIELEGCIKVFGQVRTYNEDIEGHNKLNIVVFAKELFMCEEDEENINEIYLEGFLCKVPLQRTSPLGRKICDIMLAVNRMYNKSDYIPCIAWGRNALYASSFDVGEKIAIKGRLQSRQYRKKTAEGDTYVKTAYEVSILQLEIFPAEER